jgi:hypothetical protein
VRFEHVAHPAHGVDQLRFVCVVDLRAQPPDRRIDDVRVAVEVHVPHLRCDRRARQDLALAAHQQPQQREFLRGQQDRVALPRGLAARQVEFEIGHAQRVRIARLAAPQDRLDARGEFDEVERLREIVVGAEFEALHAIADVVARSQE